MTIVVAPLHGVENAIRTWRPSHVVSLGSPGAASAAIPEELERLQLTFHDIVELADGLSPMTEAQMAELLAFGAAWPRTAPLLVHCWAGVSRSPAAAYVLACMIHEDRSPDQLARRLRQVAPWATPNRRMVGLADQALSRDGAMLSAIAGIGRGAETAWGNTFCLDPRSG